MREVTNVDQILEKYVPGKVLGDGNFAVVKQCKTREAEDLYAMKIIDKSKLRGKHFSRVLHKFAYDRLSFSQAKNTWCFPRLLL